jgi:hypothetical protein
MNGNLRQVLIGVVAALALSWVGWASIAIILESTTSSVIQERIAQVERTGVIERDVQRRFEVDVRNSLEKISATVTSVQILLAGKSRGR